MHFPPVNILGLMSGTSLDGLDLCLVQFEGKGKIKWKILRAETRSYNPELVFRLKNAHLQSDADIELLDRELGELFAQYSLELSQGIAVDLIASHGHTVKHQPSLGFTLQIGNPLAMHSALGCPVVFDFRSQDVKLGGQGAPLVPIGDKMLFDEYDFCVNIGGFANFSTSIDGERIAADLCPVNVVLNALSEKLGMAYDDRGMLAKKGKVNYNLLRDLNGLDFYGRAVPKSLGREWVDQEIEPLLVKSGLKEEDSLATFTEHVAMQIAKTVASGRALFTGGGVKNQFLIERIRYHSKAQIEIPSLELIDFKEALVFALLGLLRIHSQINVLSSVTGALHDHVSGNIIGGQSV